MRLSILLVCTVVFLGLACVKPAAAQQANPGTPVGPQPTVSPVPVRVQVNRIDVSRNRILSAQEIDAVVKPYAGHELTVKDLHDIAKRLTDRMRAKGYFVAEALLPAQQINDGVVHIDIFEGRIGNVSVEGNRYYSKGFILSRFMVAAANGLIERRSFQRALLLLNENTDLTVRAFLKPGQQPGTTDVVLKVDDALPLHGGVGYDNFGTPQTSEHRATVFVEEGNLSGRGDSVLVQSVIGLEGKGSDLIQTSYTTPLNPDGLRLGVSYANGAFTVGQNSTVLDIRGQAEIYGLSVTDALVRSLSTSQDVSLGTSYKNVTNGFDPATTSRDIYTTLRLGWQGDWRELSGRTIVSASVTRGLAGSGPDDRRASNVSAYGDFYHANLDVAQIQTLNDWAYLILRGSAQITGEPLYTAEQFSLGGADSVRGYQQSQVLGDAGYILSSEMRVSPFAKSKDEFQLAFFVDSGGAHLNKPQVGERPTQYLTGAGFGFRYNPMKQMQLRLDLGFPLVPGVNASRTSPVLYAQMNTRF